MIVEAWGATRAACLCEAALGLAEAFADPDEARAVVEGRTRVRVDIEPADDDELLVAFLDDVVYAIDTLGAVPVAVTLEDRRDGGVSGWLETVPGATLSEVGATPKGVSRSDLAFGEEEAGSWRCQVEIDV